MSVRSGSLPGYFEIFSAKIYIDNVVLIRAGRPARAVFSNPTGSSGTRRKLKFRLHSLGLLRLEPGLQAVEIDKTHSPLCVLMLFRSDALDGGLESIRLTGDTKICECAATETSVRTPRSWRRQSNKDRPNGSTKRDWRRF